MSSEAEQTPELSIVVPILNEREQLPGFLAGLAEQRELAYELLICDGGSRDGGPEWLRQQEAEHPALRVLTGPSGRGRQLNQGARQARGRYLLFLHVDSRFSDPLALRKGVASLARTGSARVAGHFALRFARTDDRPSSGYYFYEWKARLGRPETIHGDQGFLLRREMYDRLGGFREDLPAMEDTDFAERLRCRGQWRLLPAEIATSARRFETEGLWQRQLLGALIMCFRSIGWQEFFDRAPAIYRQQSETETLRLTPFFELIRHQLGNKSRHDRWRVWHASGMYVRKHAWQLFFALDARRAFHRGLPVGRGRTVLTTFFEPIYDLLTDHPLGRMAATLLLRAWFETTRAWLRRKEAR